MSRFDEEPERDIHDECQHEIQRLNNELTAWDVTVGNLTMENAALLKANIDCVNNFDAIEEDFGLVTYEGDALRRRGCAGSRQGDDMTHTDLIARLRKYQPQSGYAWNCYAAATAIERLETALRLVMDCAGDVATTDAELESALSCGDTDKEKKANAWLVARGALRPDNARGTT